MRTLELFCGTKSFTKVAKKYVGLTITSDIDKSFEPDICASVFDLNFSKNEFDIIWASPPCETFSIASVSHHWNKDRTPKGDKAKNGLKILEKTISIIKEVKPKYWFIENPRGMMRKIIDERLKGLDYKRETVCYCRYGDTRMKPTDIWTNCFEWKPVNKMCHNGNPDHKSAPRGSRTGTQGLKDYKTRSIIPPLLFEDIFNSIELLLATFTKTHS